MSKLWCIALALGDPADGMVVVSMQVGNLQEMAVAQAVSDVYRQTGTKLPLMGVNARELTREYLEAALHAMDEAAPVPDPVVRLVQPQVAVEGTVTPLSDEHRKALEGSGYIRQTNYVPPDKPA